MRMTVISQRGYVGALAVLSVGVLISALAVTVMLKMKAEGQTMRSDEQLLEIASLSLERWHRERPGEAEPLDLSTRATVETLLSALSIDQIDSRIRLARSSLRQSRNGVAFTRYAFWIPSQGSSDNVVWSSASDDFVVTGTPQLEFFSSEAVQTELTANTLARLRNAAARFEAYAFDRLNRDPNRDVGVNYFRPISGSCSGVPSSDIPCIDEPTPLTSVTLPSVLASGYSVYDAWGRVFRVSNALPSIGADSPPFRLVIDAIPPGVNDLTGSTPAPTAVVLSVSALTRLN